MEKEKLVKLIVDTQKGNVGNKFSVSDASNAIRKEFVELMGTDKPDYRTFRKYKTDIFEILEVVLDQKITEGFGENNFFEQFVEYRDLNLGDKNEFYVEDRTMLSVSEIADGHLNLRRQRLDVGESFSVSTRTYGAKVYADFLRFLAGRIDWSALVNKIEQAMKQQMAETIYNSFLGATQYLPAEFKASGTFTESELDRVVSHVQASNRGANVVIAGTKNALKKINGAYTQGFYSDGMKDQLNQNGFLNVWQGIQLLEIPQVHTPNTFNFHLDDNKLMILPGDVKPIKVVREGESIIEETTEGTNMDMSKEYTFITKYGVAVIFNVLYGMYELA